MSKFTTTNIKPLRNFSKGFYEEKETPEKGAVEKELSWPYKNNGRELTEKELAMFVSDAEWSELSGQYAFFVALRMMEQAQDEFQKAGETMMGKLIKATKQITQIEPKVASFLLENTFKIMNSGWLNDIESWDDKEEKLEQSRIKNLK